MTKDLGNCQKCNKELTVSNYHYLIEKHVSLCDECMKEWLAIRKLETDFIDLAKKAVKKVDS